MNSSSVSTTEEQDYVDECPSCGTRFLGMTPEEFRNEHAEECNPVLSLLYFPEGSR